MDRSLPDCRPPSPGAESDRLPSIQALRGVAATMVVAYHIYSHGLLVAAPLAGFEWLKQGVPIFFVISGFVMIHSTADGRTSPGRFLVRRIVRVVPLYWIATFCWIAPAPRGQWLDAAASALFLPLIDAQGTMVRPPVLDVGWSLDFEMAFYLLFAAALCAPARWTFGLVTAALLLLCWIGHRPDAGAIARFYGSPLLLDFVAGMAIARLRLRAPGWCLPLGFAALALVPLVTDVRVLCVTIPAALVVASALSLDRARLDGPMLRLIGDGSYAIYLSHMFPIAFLCVAVHDHGGGPSLASALLIPICLALGVLLHRTVEAPLHHFLRDLVRPRRRSGPAWMPLTASRLG